MTRGEMERMVRKAIREACRAGADRFDGWNPHDVYAVAHAEVNDYGYDRIYGREPARITRKAR